MRRPTFSMTGSPLRMERPRSPCSRRPIHAAYWTVERPVEAQLARAALAFTVASTDSAIMASIGSPGVRWRSAKTPGGDQQQHRDGRDQPAEDQAAHRGRRSGYFSQTSLKRIIPSGIGS